MKLKNAILILFAFASATAAFAVEVDGAACYRRCMDRIKHDNNCTYICYP